MDVIAFEISGRYGHFKKPYSVASPVTYPFPPTTAVLGMIGAVCGYGKLEYHRRIGWDKVKIAVTIVNPVRKMKAGLNHINVKNNKQGWKFFGNQTHKPTNHEFLKEPRFRIHVAGAEPECMQDLRGFLEAEQSIYTPCLGLAECLAGIDYLGTFQGKKLAESEHPVTSVAPETKARLAETEIRGKRIVRLRVPDRMNPHREVSGYVPVMYDDLQQPLQVRTAEAVQVNKETVVFF